MRDYVIPAIAAAIIALFLCLIVTGSASACVADVGTAKTEVYVRDIATGEIVGSLRGGDRVIVSGERKGWYRVEIGEKSYKVYGEYMTVEEACMDEVDVVSKVRRSKSAGNVLRGVTAHEISGSVFEEVDFW